MYLSNRGDSSQNRRESLYSLLHVNLLSQMNKYKTFYLIINKKAICESIYLIIIQANYRNVIKSSGLMRKSEKNA